MGLHPVQLILLLAFCGGYRWLILRCAKTDGANATDAIAERLRRADTRATQTSSCALTDTAMISLSVTENYRSVATANAQRTPSPAGCINLYANYRAKPLAPEPTRRPPAFDQSDLSGLVMHLTKQGFLDFVSTNLPDNAMLEIKMEVEQPCGPNSLIGIEFGSAAHMIRNQSREYKGRILVDYRFYA